MAEKGVAPEPAFCPVYTEAQANPEEVIGSRETLQALAHEVQGKVYVLFVCGHNAGRSQMAQAIFNRTAAEMGIADRVEAMSGGTGIKGDGIINLRVVASLQEIEIDIADNPTHYPKIWKDPSIMEKWDNVGPVYTMGCMDKALELPGEKKVTGDWKLNDPASPDTNVDEVRDQVVTYCRALCKQLQSIFAEQE